jgi:hypothetical protein
MGYDLHLYRDQGQPSLDRNEFARHFQGRPHYQTSETEAAYLNPDTGVHFQFCWSEDGLDGVPGAICFSLNYLRPHVFGLEAEPEVRALVEEHQLVVQDGMYWAAGRCPYSTEGFLRSWNTGNRLACESVLRGEDRPRRIWTLPSKRLRRCWRWNHERAERNAKLERGEDTAFYPQISFFADGDRVRTCVVWTEDIPTALPDVDYLRIVRLKSIADSRHVLALVPRRQLAAVASHFEPRSGPLGCLMPRYSETPREILRFCARWNTLRREPEGLSLDEILERELVEEFLPKGRRR